MAIGESKLPEIMEGAIVWDPSGDNLEFTPVLGAIRIKSEQETQEIKQSGYGNTPIDHRTSGKIGNTIEFDVTRPDLTRLINTIYGATLGTGSGSVEAVIGNKSGNSLYADAKEVRIKPIEDDVISTTLSEHVVFFKCSEPVEALDLGYAIDEQQIFSVKMFFYPSRATATLGQLYKIGTDA
jgi:hypothetical protein